MFLVEKETEIPATPVIPAAHETSGCCPQTEEPAPAGRSSHSDEEKAPAGHSSYSDEAEAPAGHTSHSDEARAPAGHSSNSDEAKALTETLYSCGMHPHVIQDEPGNCPICGMNLTPMKSEVETQGRETREGLIEIDPVVEHNMGVRVAPVEKGSISRRVRTFGEVEVAENLVSVVNLRFSGWIEELFADETGRYVERGQPLFSIYSPELVTAQEEYLLAVDDDRGGLARAAVEKFRLWGLPVSVLEEAARSGEASRTVVIRSPRSGYILHKNAVEGAAVKAGADLFHIAGLDRIWVHAKIYEIDAPWVTAGANADLELPFQPGKTYKGEVGFLYPTLDRGSRTVEARLEFDNPDLELKPGMSATVSIKTRPSEDTLVIPSEAIIHTGERKLVFVARTGGGKYEPREIITGQAGDGSVIEVLSGLTAGEQVVVSGQFLLDSESQLREAVRKMLEVRNRT